MRKLICKLFGHKWKRTGWDMFLVSRCVCEVCRCKRCYKEKLERKNITLDFSQTYGIIDNTLNEQKISKEQSNEN